MGHLFLPPVYNKDIHLCGLVGKHQVCAVPKLSPAVRYPAHHNTWCECWQITHTSLTVLELMLLLLSLQELVDDVSVSLVFVAACNASSAFTKSSRVTPYRYIHPHTLSVTHTHLAFHKHTQVFFNWPSWRRWQRLGRAPMKELPR